VRANKRHVIFGCLEYLKKNYKYDFFNKIIFIKNSRIKNFIQRDSEISLEKKTVIGDDEKKS
jgi:hypothetical protein